MLKSFCLMDKIRNYRELANFPGLNTSSLDADT